MDSESENTGKSKWKEESEDESEHAGMKRNE